MNRRELIAGMSGAAACSAFGSFFKQSNMAEGAIFKNDAPARPWKWSTEAALYEKNGGKTKCLVCPNHCELSPGDRSACRVKVNIGGIAYTLAYGNPCAINVDPIEKKPLFHFHPGTSAFSLATAGCNLRCLNCQNWEISQKKPEETNNYELFPDDVVAAARKNKVTAIAYTYSEPTAWYEYMCDIARSARKSSVKNVWVTNGYMSRAGLEPLCQYLDAANVDLKAFSEKTYNELNGGRLKPVLETLKTLHEYQVWFEVTLLMVPTYTDSLETVQQIAGWMARNLGPGYPLHVSRFHPEHKLQHLLPTPVDTLFAAQEAALAEGLHFVYVGNVPGANRENTTCPACKKTVIKRSGFAIDEINIKKGACAFCNTAIAGRF